MFKHILVLIVLSVLAVIFRAELAIVLQWFLDWHQHVWLWLGSVFSQDKIGVIAQSTLALLVIPLVIAAIVACVLWLLKRKMTPFLPEMMWVLWLVLLALITRG